MASGLESRASSDNPLTSEQVHGFLLQTGHIKEIRIPSSLILAKTDQEVEGLEKMGNKYLSSQVASIYSFLRAPIIIDTFANHEERRSWRKALPVQILTSLDTNALRVNNIGAALNALETISALAAPSSLQGKSKLTTLVRNAQEFLGELQKPGWYDTLTVKEKLAFVEKTKKFLTGAVAILATLYSS